MSKLAKALSSAAGNAGGAGLNVEDVFSTYLWAGNNSTQTITTGIDVAGEGGLIWTKPRTTDSTDSNHKLFDTARGQNKVLYTNRTNVQETGRPLTYTSTGFTLDAGSPYYGFNKTGVNYASWTFRKAPGFFDVVTYTGNGVAGRQIAHSLNGTVGSVMIKVTSTTSNWFVWHRSLNQNGLLSLNLTNAVSADGVITASSDTTVTLENWLNSNGKEYVMYLFAHDVQEFGADGDESVIKCGSYTTDGSGNATVNLGFDPQWILSKRTNATGAWYIRDVMRGMPVDGDNALLSPNTSGAEAASSFALRPSATGFTAFNDAASQTNIYIAIRRPMKVPESGTEVFNGVLTYSDNSLSTGFPVDIGFPVDLAWVTYTSLASGALWMHRLTGLTSNPQPGKGKLAPSGTTAEGNSGELWGGDNNTGYRIYGHSYQRICYGFKRAAGFMDMVSYTGTGSATTQAHNLGAVPELMIVKCRSEANQFWAVYAGDPTDFLQLNTTAASGDLASVWNDTSPTSGVFTVGTRDEVNGSAKTYIAYLFATLAGVSKVGSYTGAGAYSLNLDMGFTGGARFFLCKRTDASGDWYYWDTMRGIVAGNDPYLLLNTTATQVTNTDYVDPLAAGLTLTAAGSSTINVSGGSYIFLAIA